MKEGIVIQVDYNLSGVACDYHTKKVIKNTTISIVASQIKVDANHKIVLDTTGNPLKVGTPFSANLSIDGSYIIANLSSGIFQVDVTDGTSHPTYGSNSYFVVINGYDVHLDIELAKVERVRKIMNDMAADVSMKKLKFHEVFFKD